MNQESEIDFEPSLDVENLEQVVLALAILSSAMFAGLVFWSIWPLFLVLAVIMAAFLAAAKFERSQIVPAVFALIWGLILFRLGSFLSGGIATVLSIVGFAVTYFFVFGFTLDLAPNTVGNAVERTATGVDSRKVALSAPATGATDPNQELREVFGTAAANQSVPKVSFPGISDFVVSMLLLFALSGNVGYEPKAPTGFSAASKETWLLLNDRDRKQFERLSRERRETVNQAPEERRPYVLERETRYRVSEERCPYGGSPEFGCVTRREMEAAGYFLDSFLDN